MPPNRPLAAPVPANPGDPITAGAWNDLQVQLRVEHARHLHTGRWSEDDRYYDGDPLGAEGLQDGAVTPSKLQTGGAYTVGQLSVNPRGAPGVRLGVDTVQLGDTAGGPSALAHMPTARPFGGEVVEGPALWGAGGGALGSRVDGGRESVQLRWTPTGVDVRPALRAGAGLTVQGATALNGDTTLVGALSVRGTLNGAAASFSGAVVVGQALQVGGAASVGGNLSVGAALTAQALSVGGSTTVGGGLGVSGTLTAGAFATGGNASVAGQLTVAGTLQANGRVNAPAGVNVQGAVAHIEVDGSFYRNTDGQVYITVDDLLRFRKTSAGSHGAELDLRTGKLSLTGELNAASASISGTATINTLAGLNVADNFGATIRCADFSIGHSSRKGRTGRALVDSTDTLVINYGGDWPKTLINSALTVSGTFTAVNKWFRIPHPLRPDTHDLVHCCLEGPENGVYYRGEAALHKGACEVVLPAWFEALTTLEGRTVLLTAIADEPGPVSALACSRVRDGRFTVHSTDALNPEQPFFWEVKAVRADVPLLETEVDREPPPDDME